MAYLLVHMIIVDISAAYICSFTTNESVEMYTERPVLFFFVFFVVNIVLNSAFNCLGYGFHLFYCIFFEGGSYSSGNIVCNCHISICLAKLNCCKNRTMAFFNDQPHYLFIIGRSLVLPLALFVQIHLVSVPIQTRAHISCTFFDQKSQEPQAYCFLNCLDLSFRRFRLDA